VCDQNIRETTFSQVDPQKLAKAILAVSVGRIHSGSTLEEFQVLSVLHWMLWDPEIEREPGVAQAQPGAVEKISARGIWRN